ncbi:MAG: protein translocase subunit SecD [Coriobacteriia bacterium]|nr:protein translocase subunit SecD [Coriobacteriia bacterium]
MDKRQKNLLLLAGAALLVVGSWLLFWPPQERITQGLDIQGGLSVILRAEAEPGQEVTPDMMERAETVLRNRVDGLGVREASVQRQGTNQLVIQIPGIDDPQTALDVLGETGRLEFVDVASINDTEVAALFLSSPGSDIELKPGTYAPIEIDGVRLTGEVVKDAQVAQDQTGALVVNIQMTSDGARAWGVYTSTHIGQQVAVVLDGVVKSAPVVSNAIMTGDTQISGNFTADEARNLRTVLVSGSLPVTLVTDETLIVGPTLGQDSLSRGVLAVVIGLSLVAVYVTIYYRGLGLITVGSLLAFASTFVGVLALMSMAGVFSLTLPGIAGIALTIGLAADASVLVNERILEEVRGGKSISAAVDSGSKHGIMTAIDANVVTLVSALMLYLVAVGMVKGFALTLMIGIACNVAIMFLFGRPAVILLGPVIEKRPKLWGLAPQRPSSTKGGDSRVSA